MPASRWSELSICADFDLPELPVLESQAGGGAEWRVALERTAPPERPGLAWFHQWAFPDGRPWVAFGRDAAGYRLRFQNLADFDIFPAARSIRCHARADTPLHTVRHLLLDQVLPLVAG